MGGTHIDVTTLQRNAYFFSKMQDLPSKSVPLQANSQNQPLGFPPYGKQNVWFFTMKMLVFGVIWGDLVWCGAYVHVGCICACNVIWCDVRWCDMMWYDVIWCVVMWGWIFMAHICLLYVFRGQGWCVVNYVCLWKARAPTIYTSINIFVEAYPLIYTCTRPCP